MIRESLRETLAHLAGTPVIWITGLYLGAFFAADILLQVSGSTLVASRAGFLGLVAAPFFLGGTYGVIRGDGSGLRAYLTAGSRYFFRILLAGAVTVSVALFTALLVMLPILIVGGSLQAAIPSALLGVGVSFAFFTAFVDTAVVFEDRKVLDSIRRSVEFVTGNLKTVLGFYLANLAIGFAVFFVSVVIWSFTIADRLLPLVEGNQTVIQNLTAPDMVSLVGLPGLMAGVTIGFFAITFGATLLVAFKACYFRRVAASTPAPVAQGEFDEKGRWY